MRLAWLQFPKLLNYISILGILDMAIARQKVAQAADLPPPIALADR